MATEVKERRPPKGGAAALSAEIRQVVITREVAIKMAWGMCCIGNHGMRCGLCLGIRRM